MSTISIPTGMTVTEFWGGPTAPTACPCGQHGPAPSGSAFSEEHLDHPGVIAHDQWNIAHPAEAHDYRDSKAASNV